MRFGCCCRTVMFSVVSVCLSVCLSVILSVKRRVPMWPLPMMPLVRHRSHGTSGHVQTFSLGEVSDPGPALDLVLPAYSLIPLLCYLPTWDTPNPDTQDMFKLVYYVPQTSVGKWVVGIRLKCLLIYVLFMSMTSFRFNLELALLRTNKIYQSCRDLMFFVFPVSIFSRLKKHQVTNITNTCGRNMQIYRHKNLALFYVTLWFITSLTAIIVMFFFLVAA